MPVSDRLTRVSHDHAEPASRRPGLAGHPLREMEGHVIARTAGTRAGFPDNSNDLGLR